LPATILAAGVALVALLALGGTRPAPASAETGVSIDRCIEVQSGDTFDVTIQVADVTNIIAWDILYAFNRNVVEVTDRDVRHILESLPNSNVVDVSDPVPNVTGSYRLGAADLGGVDAAEVGSGILATITLTAKREGLSWSTLYRVDANNDGAIDIGPTLTSLGGAHIADTNGDSFFDGPIVAGQIAVDRECAEQLPTPPPPPGVVVTEPGGIGTPTIQAETPAVPSSEDPAATPASTEDEGNDPSPRTAVDADLNSPSSGGDSGVPLSTWLIGLLAGSVALGVVLSYVIYKTARRPA
jgi:hypothetical protein